MTWKILVPILIISLIFISGCAGTTDVTGVAKTIPEVKAFLEDHPNAKVTAILWRSSYIKDNLDMIEDDCIPAIDTNKDHYRVEITEEGDTIVSWLTADTREAVCIVREGSGVEEETTEQQEVTGRQKELESQPSASLSLISQSYSNSLLEVDIKNTGGLDLSLNSYDIIMVLEDGDGNTVCPSVSLNSNTLKCNSGCSGTLAPNEIKRLKVDISSCGTLTSGETYYYQLKFQKGATVSGSFKHYGASEGETGEQQPVEEATAAASLITQSYDGLLSIDIQNTGGVSISLDDEDIIMTLENQFGDAFCSAGNLDSENFDCTSGCIGIITPNEIKRLKIDMIKCMGSIVEGYNYYYQLKFKEGASVSGSFTG